jgi:hypothetical protein
VTRERLSEKLASKTGMVWRWITQPGKHDYGDVMAMLFVAAAYSTGIGAGGIAEKIEKPKARVFISRPSNNMRGHR